jgi:hypothetical protein
MYTTARHHSLIDQTTSVHIFSLRYVFILPSICPCALPCRFHTNILSLFPAYAMHAICSIVLDLITLIRLTVDPRGRAV